MNKTNIKNINWLNHGIEFFVVLFGILLAFQLNIWSENRKNAELINLHLSEIIKETEFNIRSLENGLDKVRQDIELIELFLTTRNDPDADTEQLDGQLLANFNMRGVYFKKNAYETLIQSGDIKLIKDFATKSQIVALYEFYEYTGSIDNYQDQFRNDELLAFAMTHLDLVDNTAQGLEVYQDDRLHNVQGVSKFWLKQRQTNYQKTSQFAEALISTLKSSIDD